MAETAANKSQSLAEEYHVSDKQEKTAVVEKPVEVKEVENPQEAGSVEAVVEKIVEETTPVAPAVAQESSEVSPPPAEESAEESTEEQSSGNVEDNSGNEDAAEKTPEIKLETAPADFRFPTTNQTRHCFTRYIEYHRCVAAKGEGASECDKFAKYYRSLCPGEWIDRWNEQRENGTFPGPL
ncbi:cytochrome c oxidase subunit 6b-1 [Vigna radiata var. radiata]|uniref:Cytochrome c oxidase subunit 6b-1 n=1 Tax=Vigna radiata var. radiata TaxID=3916 RepID=A0A1S3VV60_VIGRR|nr:cytochrome c oxidase subunit 6b-1 [Vigna radiata var. radiata]7JRO_g Chain g, cytochrome c oxidase subunit 6b-1 [Vigna radiata var. radiata]7JRP_g Chain g, cytochrome c oxidase subunit 6b-1 [Vigna radiata var. radiata]